MKPHDENFVVICDQSNNCQRDQRASCIYAHPLELRDVLRIDYRIISCVFSPSGKAHFQPQPFVIVEDERELL